MPTYAILRQSHTPAGMFAAATECLRHTHEWTPEDEKIPEWVALTHGATAEQNFGRAAAFLMQQLEDTSDLAVLVDEVDAQRLNPLSDKGWSSLIASLILAFPEIRWHFLVVTGKPASIAPQVNGTAAEEVKYWDQIYHQHGAESIADARGCSLFDGHGLRHYIHEQMLRAERARAKSQVVQDLPARKKLAIVLDEETGFAHFEAYMAYRFGFRVHAISSWAEAENLLGLKPGETKDKHTGNGQEIALSIEDLFLNYPDQHVHEMSDLEQRERILPKLSSAPPLIRRFVTVGHERQKAKATSRRRYLKGLRQAERTAFGHRVWRGQQITYKPASGLFTLWREMGMFRVLRKGVRECLASGHAPGFQWPPSKSTPGDADGEGDGHSSPGRLVQIAEHLIRRAQALIDHVDEVCTAIRGAVLATQALELLGCKTPTLSVEALSLKHRFEVLAECQFAGVEYHLSMQERLKEIERNLEAMGRWLHRSRASAFRHNAEAMILTRLIAILDKHGEYEESELCQVRLRSLHRQISMAQDIRQGRFSRVLFWPLNMYIGFVLRSFQHFFWSLMAVIAGFGLIFATTKPCSFWEGLHETFLCMFTVGLPNPFSKDNPAGLTMTLTGYAASVAGLVHFGLLVTHLYGKVRRR